MFFKKVINNCLKLDEAIKIILPDKSVKHVEPSSYLNVAKSNRNDLNVESDNLTYHIKDIINERLPKFVCDVNRNQKSTRISLIFNRHSFLANTLNHFKYGVNNYKDFFGHEMKKKKILIEFGSPNIAKKLHFGNFRSTLTGNFLSNLFEYKGHDLNRMNYYGDWGTQFGVLSVAFDKFGSEEQLNLNPIQHLIDIYVKGSLEAESNTEFYEECKRRFALLENSMSTYQNDLNNEQKRIKKQWETFRKLSLKVYEKDFEKLRVKFDTVNYESTFNEKAKKIFSDKSNENLVFKEDGSVYFKIDKKKEEILLKSDGSTLYISRDLVAAIERMKEFKFDICYYVVDVAQSNHFKKLKTILKKMNYDWSNVITHIPFGRINNMSTRNGTATLLDEVIRVSEHLSLESTISNKNSKITFEELETTKFELALACLITNVFKHKRLTNLDFDLKFFTNQSCDNSGVALMYTYSRLCNLKLNSGINLDLNCDLDFDALKGNESYYLLLLLSQFDEIIEQSCFLLEPQLLMHYVFNLKTAINRAYNIYTIKGQSKSCGQTRLLLFHCAQQVYEQALRLSGIKPLEKI